MVRKSIIINNNEQSYFNNIYFKNKFVILFINYCMLVWLNTEIHLQIEATIYQVTLSPFFDISNKNKIEWNRNNILVFTQEFIANVCSLL